MTIIRNPRGNRDKTGKSIILGIKLPVITGVSMSFWIALGYVALSGLAILILSQSLAEAHRPKPQDDIIYEKLTSLVAPLNQTLANQLAEIRILRADNADLELKTNLLAKAEADLKADKTQEASLLAERSDLYDQIADLRNQIALLNGASLQSQVALVALQDRLTAVNNRTSPIVNSVNATARDAFYGVWDLWWSGINS
jgi:phage I-like protein